MVLTNSENDVSHSKVSFAKSAAYKSFHTYVDDNLSEIIFQFSVLEHTNECKVFNSGAGWS